MDSSTTGQKDDWQRSKFCHPYTIGNCLSMISCALLMIMSSISWLFRITSTVTTMIHRGYYTVALLSSSGGSAWLSSCVTVTQDANWKMA